MMMSGMILTMVMYVVYDFGSSSDLTTQTTVDRF